MKEDEIAALPETENFEKMCKLFVVLPEDRQDYIFGIMQALVFASNNLPPKKQQGKPIAENLSDLHEEKRE